MTKKNFADGLKKIAPFALHLLIALIVALYALFGAFVMQQLENGRHCNNTKGFCCPNTGIGVGQSSSLAGYKSSTMIMDQRGKSMKNIEKRSVDQQQQQKILLIQRTRQCVLTAIYRIINTTKCDRNAIDTYAIKSLDECYKTAADAIKSNGKGTEKNEMLNIKAPGNDSTIYHPDCRLMTGNRLIHRNWTFMDSLVFSFTLITTIGYGDVAPLTFEGRLFVIIYGLIGIPLTMLAIADSGKFLAILLRKITRPLSRFIRKSMRNLINCRFQPFKLKKTYANGDCNGKVVTGYGGCGNDNSNMNQEYRRESQMESIADDSDGDTDDAFALLAIFLFYILIGAMVISNYEPEMDLMTAVYFNFITLTTVGLGDVVPRSETYLPFTIVYIGVGLAMTTIAIEIASDYLKKLHYFGRKMENASIVKIWFGGKRLTVKQFVKNLGDHFNVPIQEIDNMNIGEFVESAMEVEAGKRQTLRPTSQTGSPTFHSNRHRKYRSLDTDSMFFVDDELFSDLYDLRSKIVTAIVPGNGGGVVSTNAIAKLLENAISPAFAMTFARNSSAISLTIDNGDLDNHTKC